jgi:hypothetical protein
MSAHSMDDLQICVFSTGQANFVALKNQETIRIMDAGVKQSNIGLNDIVHKWHDFCRNSSVLEVFISHHHVDHYNLIQHLMGFEELNPIFGNTKFYLGGMERHWNVGQASTLINFLNDKNRPKEFLEGIGQDIPWNNNISFQVYPLNNVNTLQGNSICQLIKIIYNNYSILFTGDADGRTLENTISQSPSNGRRSLCDDDNDSSPFHYQWWQTEIQEHLTNTLHSNIVFLPHHGSESNGSYWFHNARLGDMFFICSDPNCCNHLPQWTNHFRTFVNSIPANYIPHYVHVYNQGIVMFIFDIDANGNEMLTSSNIFTTSAAPNGAYFITINPQGIYVR